MASSSPVYGTQTPEPSASSSLPRRRDDIQGLRAIAVVLVVLYHAGLPITGGFVGVDAFFVISGFVIGSMLLRQKLESQCQSPTPTLSDFYRRRFLRIVPALAMAVTVVCAAAVLFMSPLGTQTSTAATGAGAMLYVANLVLARITGGYFDVAAEANPLLNTWSLSVEEQFYFVFPLLLASAWLVSRGRRRVFALCAFLSVSVMSLLSGLAAAFGPLHWLPEILQGYYGPIGRFWEFGAGVLLAILVLAFPGWPRVSSQVATICGVSGLLLLLRSAVAFDSSSRFPGSATLVPVAGTVLLLVTGTLARNPVTRGLGASPLIWIGDS